VNTGAIILQLWNRRRAGTIADRAYGADEIDDILLRLNEGESLALLRVEQKTPIARERLTRDRLMRRSRRF
jgi:hypothetical protein